MALEASHSKVANAGYVLNAW